MISSFKNITKFTININPKLIQLQKRERFVFNLEETERRKFRIFKRSTKGEIF